MTPASRKEFDNRVDVRRAVQAFKASAATGDLDEFLKAFAQVETLWIWREAFRSLRGIEVPEPFRRLFLAIYQEAGDSLRSNIDDDAVLVSALRALLPPYDGPELTVYRGAHKDERRYRRYGHAWTTDLDVARSHASKAYHGGSGLVLRAQAPTRSIVSAPKLENLVWHESEIVIDRRRLRNIAVINF